MPRVVNLGACACCGAGGDTPPGPGAECIVCVDDVLPEGGITVVIAGITNNSCSACTSLNGSYLFDDTEFTDAYGSPYYPECRATKNLDSLGICGGAELDFAITSWDVAIILRVWPSPGRTGTPTVWTFRNYFGTPNEAPCLTWSSESIALHSGPSGFVCSGAATCNITSN